MEKNLLKVRIKSITMLVILVILSCVLWKVIDPTRQMIRAKQTLFRSNSEKTCLALLVCTGSTQTAEKCAGDTNAAALAKVGFIIPRNPIGASYLVTPLLPVPPGAKLTLTSTYDTCVFTCSATPRNGAVTNFALTSKGATCIIS